MFKFINTKKLVIWLVIAVVVLILIPFKYVVLAVLAYYAYAMYCLIKRFGLLIK